MKNKYKQPVLKNFSFRYLEGWCVRTSFEYKNKIKTLVGIDNFYIKAYLKNYLHRESCYKCRFSKFPRQGDFTLGDFWGIGRETPFIHDVQKGLSLVIVNTAKGQLIFENIKECLFEEERSLDEAVMGNKNLVESSQRPVERDFIYQDLRELSITQVAKKYNLLDSRFFIVKRGYNYLLRLLSRKK
ncbi:MAG: Coenzyme F420 hydrogenase/dehydrogenase, beta subunit C-terminal domain [Barnesiella sp.]